MPKIMLNCRRTERRRLGIPLKILLDENETGISRANWWRMFMVIYTASCLRTGHTVNMFHLKVKVVPHVPRRHRMELEVQGNWCHPPPIYAREREKVPIFIGLGGPWGQSRLVRKASNYQGSEPHRPPRSQSLQWLNYPDALCIIRGTHNIRIYSAADNSAFRQWITQDGH
jgi:hypothetical protein